MEAVDDERTLRRARRVIWAFRLIFYPGALLVALALLAAGSEVSESQSQVLTGTTGQGRKVTVTVFDGEVYSITTTVARRCTDGKDYPAPVRTFPVSMDGDTFEDLRVWRQAWPERRTGIATLYVHGRLDGDTARGTLLLDQRLGAYVCVAETDFSAG